MQAPALATNPCPSPFPITTTTAILGLTAASSSANLHLRRRDRWNILFLSSPWTSLPSIITDRSFKQIPQVKVKASGESALPLDENQNSHESTIVHVKFILRKECTFGQQLLLVGDIPQLGQWDPTKAMHLEWSDDHVWTTELVLPAEELVRFKFILQSSPEQITWQPGPDRVLQTWETTKMIQIFEDWEDAEKQKIEEKELLGSMEETKPAHDNIGVGRNAKTNEKIDGVDKGFSTNEIEEEKSLDCKLPAYGQSKYQLVPGIEPRPTLDMEMSSAASAFDVFKREERESPEKVGSGKEREAIAEATKIPEKHSFDAATDYPAEGVADQKEEMSSEKVGPGKEREALAEAIKIPEKNSFDDATDYPAEGVANQKEEMSSDDDASRNHDLPWGRETFSKLFLLAMGFFVRDLS